MFNIASILDSYNLSLMICLRRPCKMFALFKRLLWTLRHYLRSFRRRSLSSYHIHRTDERYVTLAELYTHFGRGPLPAELVKHITRDVLETLAARKDQGTVCIGVKGLDQEKILLSTQDLDWLASWQCGDRQDSDVGSSATVGTIQLPFDAAMPTVFRLVGYETSSKKFHDPPYALVRGHFGPSSRRCIIYKLLMGEPLFNPSFQTVDCGLSTDESHLIQMIEMLPVDGFLGFPEDLGEETRSDGALRLETTYYPVTLREILYRRLSGVDVDEIYVFLNGTLRLIPEERTSVSDLLQSGWITG
ncbi:hypothetical protein DFS33DRAFT_1450424 [Desarmillaria ectypa]|nr:hypothetical protein DFS33DRAFT_1450424 [Desarmillaria ectypa]